MRRLAGMTGLIAAGTVVFAAVGDEIESTYTDPAILTYIAVVYTIGVAVMLWYTRRWNTIGCGLLATMTGDALLYGRVSEHLPYPDAAWPLDLARSCFVVGGSYLVIGIAAWVIDHHRGQRDPADLTLVEKNGGE